jgi:signal peptidase II
MAAHRAWFCADPGGLVQDLVKDLVQAPAPAAAPVSALAVNLRRRGAWLAFVLLLVSADQASKVAAQANLAKPRVTSVSADDGRRTAYISAAPVNVAPGFNLRYAENRAAAFGFGSFVSEPLRRPLLLGISLALCAVMAVWALRMQRRDPVLLASLGLAVGGALGNVIDRARLGYVVDFLDVYVGHAGAAEFLRGVVNTNHWPTFNVADICIVLGGLGLSYRIARPLPDDSAPPQNDSATQAA